MNTAAFSRQATPTTANWLAVVSRCIAWVRRRQRVRRDIELLMALDDKMLADIGLARDQVVHVARLGHLPD